MKRFFWKFKYSASAEFVVEL